MKCPKCEKELVINSTKINDEERFRSGSYIEIEVQCPDDHVFFTRIHIEDFIED